MRAPVPQTQGGPAGAGRGLGLVPVCALELSLSPTCVCSKVLEGGQWGLRWAPPRACSPQQAQLWEGLHGLNRMWAGKAAHDTLVSNGAGMRAAVTRGNKCKTNPGLPVAGAVSAHPPTHSPVLVPPLHPKKLSAGVLLPPPMRVAQTVCDSLPWQPALPVSKLSQTADTKSRRQPAGIVLGAFGSAGPSRTSPSSRDFQELVTMSPHSCGPSRPGLHP